MIYITKIQSDKDKRIIQHSTGVKLLENALMKEYGIEINESDICRSENGKPFFRDYPQIYFNISHCDNAAACIVDSAVCGIDVEKLRQPNDRVAERLFSRSQLEIYHKLDGRDKSGYFTTVWTLMEAYAKADGRGFAVMKNAPFNICEKKITSDRENLTFSSHYLPEWGCILSVCSAREIIPDFARDQNPFLF